MKSVVAANVGLGVIAAVIGQADSVLEWIVLAGAAAGALGVLHAKVFAPGYLFARKAARGVDILLEMPSWRDQLHALDERVERIERTIGRRAEDVDKRVEVHVHEHSDVA